VIAKLDKIHPLAIAFSRKRYSGIPGLKIKSQKTISFEGSLPSFFLKSISFRKERSLSDRKGRLP